MKRIFAFAAAATLCGLLAGTAAFSAPPPGKGPGGETAQGNNLSFPALAVDGYAISEITQTLFTVPYVGDYPGLTAEEIAALAGDDWYPQKTEGNTWQADYLTGQAVEVSYVDWGDNIEAVNPKVGRPFRLEIQLYKQLNEWPWDGANGMTGYVMAELEYPSSSNELQGTNTMTYQGNFATVVSNLWKLRIQYCGNAIPNDIFGLYWNGSSWVGGTTTCTDVPISFAVELNVGGKVIFGGSQGGWKPKNAGWYRITFYGPATTTDLSLVDAEVGNYADFSVPPALEPLAAESDEGDEGAATPVVDGFNNISYVDVQAVAGGGGGGGGKGKPTN
jgi:hypothetical protein